MMKQTKRCDITINRYAFSFKRCKIPFKHVKPMRIPIHEIERCDIFFCRSPGRGGGGVTPGYSYRVTHVTKKGETSAGLET